MAEIKPDFLTCFHGSCSISCLVPATSRGGALHGNVHPFTYLCAGEVVGLDGGAFRLLLLQLWLRLGFKTTSLLRCISLPFEILQLGARLKACS